MVAKKTEKKEEKSPDRQWVCTEEYRGFPGGRRVHLVPGTVVTDPKVLEHLEKNRPGEIIELVDVEGLAVNAALLDPESEAIVKSKDGDTDGSDSGK